MNPPPSKSSKLEVAVPAPAGGPRERIVSWLKQAEVEKFHNSILKAIEPAPSTSSSRSRYEPTKTVAKYTASLGRGLGRDAGTGNKQLVKASSSFSIPMINRKPIAKKMPKRTVASVKQMRKVTKLELEKKKERELVEFLSNLRSSEPKKSIEYDEIKDAIQFCKPEIVVESDDKDYVAVMFRKPGQGGKLSQKEQQIQIRNLQQQQMDMKVMEHLNFNIFGNGSSGRRENNIFFDFISWIFGF